jgi:hypothetical protein
VALEPGLSPPVPPSWRWVSFAKLRFAIPKSWPDTRSSHAPSCSTDIVLARTGVTLATSPALPLRCPFPVAEERPVPQVAGIEVDDFQLPGTALPPASSCVGPRVINGLNTCVDTVPASGLLVAQIWRAGSPPITVKIGMAGDGIVGRTVLHSIRQ